MLGKGKIGGISCASVKSLENGDVNVQNYLGDNYVYGIGVHKVDKDAVKWYRIAAE